MAPDDWGYKQTTLTNCYFSSDGIVISNNGYCTIIAKQNDTYLYDTSYDYWFRPTKSEPKHLFKIPRPRVQYFDSRPNNIMSIWEPARQIEQRCRSSLNE